MSTHLNDYIVTVQTITNETDPTTYQDIPGTSSAQPRPSRASFAGIGAKLFESVIVQASSLVDAIAIVRERFSEDEPIVSAELRFKTGLPETLPPEVIAEIFDKTVQNGGYAPQPAEYETLHHRDTQGIAQLMDEITAALRDADILPGFDLTFEYDENDNPEWVVFHVFNAMARTQGGAFNTPYSAAGFDIHNFEIGDGNLSGWDLVCAITNDLLRIGTELS